MSDWFWQRVDTRTSADCWRWLGYVNEDGYGVVWKDGKHRKAHRVAYTLAVGPISEGMQIDHLCRVRACVNPAHLEPVTQSENIRRGEAGRLNNFQRAKTHCPSGHAYVEGNIYYRAGGRRQCASCVRERMRRLRTTVRASGRLS